MVPALLPARMSPHLTVGASTGYMHEQRGDYVAVLGILLPPHDDKVPVENAGVDHRVAADAEDELVSASRQRLGDAEIALDRLGSRDLSSALLIDNKPDHVRAFEAARDRRLRRKTEAADLPDPREA